MKLSSGARRFEAQSIAQHGEHDRHPSPGQGDHGLVVPLALTPLALLEGAGVRSAQAGEGGLVEDSLEHLVTYAHAAMVAHPLAGVSSHRHQTGVGGEVAGRVNAAGSPAATRNSAPRRGPMLGRVVRTSSPWSRYLARQLVGSKVGTSSSG